ncbi:hypothetical protein D1007_61389 [Hordeum vulgare]|nr:hypothetical protein D1007_61389 [Hordeum vulgare]
MPRSAGVSDAEGRANVQRREAVTIDRRKRLNAKKIRDAEAAATGVSAAAVDQEEVSRAGMMNPPGHNSQDAWRSLQGVAPATHSTTMSPWGYAHLLRYFDDDLHDDINPNTASPHGASLRSIPIGFRHDPCTPSPAFSIGLNTQYSYSSSAYSSAALPAPSMRCGILPFAPTLSLQFDYADTADMDEIIMSGSVAAASHTEFVVQDEIMHTTGDIDDELDNVEEGEGEDEAL